MWCALASGPAGCANPATLEEPPTPKTAPVPAAAPAPVAASPDASEEWFTTPEGLARAILDALETKDAAALARLRVSEKLYKEELCPAFIADKPRHTIPVDFHWRMLAANSTAGVHDALEEYGGRELEMVSLTFERIEPYETFSLLRGVKLTVRRRGSDDAGQTMRELGPIVERDGRFTLLGYRG
jgi:hypothetical protein